MVSLSPLSVKRAWKYAGSRSWLYSTRTTRVCCMKPSNIKGAALQYWHRSSCVLARVRVTWLRNRLSKAYPSYAEAAMCRSTVTELRRWSKCLVLFFSNAVEWTHRAIVFFGTQYRRSFAICSYNKLVITRAFLGPRALRHYCANIYRVALEPV